MMPPNPKQAYGDKKVQLQLVPRALMLPVAQALKNGADKYGAWNWRENPVEAMTYVAAILRHLYDWVEGEEVAPDSMVHHLGHLAASVAILLDAQATGNLIDNRPGGWV